ncbi:MAG: hypothetical protein JNK78_00225 [Planctomycetes bacterium]|nr:hypothetical protein [Planctomycetota bacterium]
MSVVSRSVLLAASLSLLGGVSLCQEGKTPPAPAAKPEKQGEKKETYSVVETGGHLTVVADGALETMRKDKHAAFEAAMKSYEKEKAAAEASKSKFDRQPPKEETIAVKKAGFGSMADAEKALSELKKEAEKAKDKEKDKPKHEGGEGAGHGGGHPEKPKR